MIVFFVRSHDTMQKCQLLLILIKKFPSLSLKYGQSLVETLVNADSGEHGKILKILCCKVLFIDMDRGMLLL